MTETSRMFMIFWPYTMVTIGLMIALVANYRIRKRSKSVIIALEKQNDFNSSYIRKMENDRTEEVISSANENARLQSSLIEIRQILDKTRECTKRDEEHIVILRAALIRIHPYTRLIINDPKKMETWVTRLMAPKPKKRKVKAE